MKFMRLIVSSIILMLFVLPYGVYALTFSDTEVITEKGVSMSYEKYYELSKKYSDSEMDLYSYQIMKTLTSDNLVHLGSDSLAVITDYVYDENGNVESITHYNFDDIDEYEKVWNNGNNDFVRGNVYDKVHSTASKHIMIDSYMALDDNLNMCYFVIELQNIWKITPKVKSYDVIAVRWNSTDVSVFNSQGYQLCESPVSYSYLGTNMVQKSNGIGISMNLVDSCTKPKNSLWVYSSMPYGTIYGTYQHSTKNITKQQSKNYSFNSEGLGEVLLFADSNVAASFDDMSGVMLNS